MLFEGLGQFRDARGQVGDFTCLRIERLLLFMELLSQVIPLGLQFADRPVQRFRFLCMKLVLPEGLAGCFLQRGVDREYRCIEFLDPGGTLLRELAGGLEFVQCRVERRIEFFSRGEQLTDGGFLRFGLAGLDSGFRFRLIVHVEILFCFHTVACLHALCPLSLSLAGSHCNHQFLFPRRDRASRLVHMCATAHRFAWHLMAIGMIRLTFMS